MRIDQITKAISYADTLSQYNFIIEDIVAEQQKGHKHHRKMKNKIEALMACEKIDISEEIDLCFLTTLANVIKANGKNEGEVAKVICSFQDSRKEKLLCLYKEQVRNR